MSRERLSRMSFLKAAAGAALGITPVVTERRSAQADNQQNAVGQGITPAYEEVVDALLAEIPEQANGESAVTFFEIRCMKSNRKGDKIAFCDTPRNVGTMALPPLEVPSQL